MSAQVPVEIRGFTGLNSYLPAHRIEDGDLSELSNFLFGNAGELQRRKGFAELYDGASFVAPVKLLGFFDNGTIGVFLATDGNSLFKSTNVTAWTSIGTYSGIMYGVQYVDKFYLVRDAGTILEFDGTSVTSLVGSPSGTHCVIFKDRLFVLNSTSPSHPSRFYYSSPGTPDVWPGTNFIDVEVGNGDVLTGCIPYQDRLFFFKNNSIHALYVQSDPSSWVLRSVNTERGCVSGRTLIDTLGLIWFMSADGVYKTDGVTFDEVSIQIRDAFYGRPDELTMSDHGCRFGDNIIWRLTRYDGSWRYYIYNTNVGAWSRWITQGQSAPAFFHYLNNSYVDAGIYCGSVNSNRISYYGETNSYLDGEDTYPSRIVTKAFDIGASLNYKRHKWSGIEFTGENEVDVSYIVDGVSEPEPRQIAISSRLAMYKVEGVGHFRLLSVVIEITEDGPLAVYGLSLVLHLKRTIIATGV